MAGEPTVTICGSAGDDAQLKFLPSGLAVAEWSMAVTPRVKVNDQWQDAETVWYRCSAWRQLGESAAESITKGMRLLVHGRLKVRTYEHQGATRTSLEIEVEHVGAEMRYASVSARKVERHPGEDRSSQQPAYSGGAPSSDPWGGDAGSEIPPF